jgi:hypothetical protein
MAKRIELDAKMSGDTKESTDIAKLAAHVEKGKILEKHSSKIAGRQT